MATEGQRVALMKQSTHLLRQHEVKMKKHLFQHLQLPEAVCLGGLWQLDLDGGPFLFD